MSKKELKIGDKYSGFYIKCTCGKEWKGEVKYQEQFPVDQSEEKKSYDEYSHTHCWDNKLQPCGIDLCKHTQCCLCEKLNPYSKQETNIWQEHTEDIIDPKKNWQEINSGSWEKEFEIAYCNFEFCNKENNIISKPQMLKLKDFISKTISQAKEDQELKLRSELAEEFWERYDIEFKEKEDKLRAETIELCVKKIEVIRKSYLGSGEFLSEIGKGAECIVDDIITTLKSIEK